VDRFVIWQFKKDAKADAPFYGAIFCLRVQLGKEALLA
jgi:hypothetical protein